MPDSEPVEKVEMPLGQADRQPLVPRLLLFDGRSRQAEGHVLLHGEGNATTDGHNLQVAVPQR